MIPIISLSAYLGIGACVGNHFISKLNSALNKEKEDQELSNDELKIINSTKFLRSELGDKTLTRCLMLTISLFWCPWAINSLLKKMILK